MRSLAAAVICTCVVGSGLSPGLAEDPRAGGRATASREAESPLSAKLSAPAELAFQDTPLSELPNWLRVHHGVQAILDVKTLEDIGVARDAPITLKLRGVSLHSALRHLLRQQDLTWRVDGELLIVTTPEEAEQHLRAVVYPVLDLVQKADKEEGEPDLDYDTLIDLLMTQVAPDSWPEGTGPGPIAPAAGSFVVPQTDDVHEQIAALLAALRQAKQQASAADASERVSTIYVEPAGNARIRAELAKPTALEFAVTPLDKVAEQVAEAHGIPVVLDEKALEDAGKALGDPVSLASRGLTLGQTLRHALEPLELVAVPHNEALMITTAVEAEQSCLKIRLYPVSDIVSANPSGNSPADPETILDALLGTVAEDAWDEVGGPGSASYFPISQALVISQIDEVHDQIAQFLAEYRAAQAKLPPATPRKEPADDEMSLRFYRVFPGNEALTAQQVGELLHEFVAPLSWSADKDVSLRAAGNQLVVRQRHAVHREIEQFLKKLGVTPQGMGGGPGMGSGPGMGMFHVPHKTPDAPPTVKDRAAP
ncbi:MAG: hypothetical protein U0836_09755 [Pirellulales bacterium]